MLSAYLRATQVKALSYRAVAAALTRMAQQGAADLNIRCVASTLWDSSAVRRLYRAWMWLPTQYVRDRDGDNWQAAALTNMLRMGDCEDWAVLLAALLLVLGIDAHVGVVPGHAFCCVRLQPAMRYQLDIFGRMIAIPNQVESLPGNWPTYTYQGQNWLFLEATTIQAMRGLPGTQMNLILPGLNSSTLVIGGT